MWKSGAEQKLFQCFQRLGICKGSKGAKVSVEKLCREFDIEIRTWKKELEIDASNRSTG